MKVGYFDSQQCLFNLVRGEAALTDELQVA